MFQKIILAEESEPFIMYPFPVNYKLSFLGPTCTNSILADDIHVQWLNIFQVHLFLYFVFLLSPLPIFVLFMCSFRTTDLLGNSYKNTRAILARLATILDLCDIVCSLSLVSLLPFAYGTKLVFVIMKMERGYTHLTL